MRIGGTHFSGECWVEAPRLIQNKKAVCSIPFTKFAQKPDKYAGFEGHKHTVAYIRLASLQKLLTAVSGKVWTNSAVGKQLRENGLVEVGKDGHTAKSKFPKLGRFVPLNKIELEKQAKIRK